MSFRVDAAVRRRRSLRAGLNLLASYFGRGWGGPPDVRGPSQSWGPGQLQGCMGIGPDRQTCTCLQSDSLSAGGEVLKWGLLRRGRSSRASVAACGTVPGLDLYLLASRLWKGVERFSRCGVPDELLSQAHNSKSGDGDGNMHEYSLVFLPNLIFFLQSI